MAHALLPAHPMDSRTLILVCGAGGGIGLTVRDLALSRGFAAYLSTGMEEVESLLTQRLVRPAALVFCSSGRIPEDLGALRTIREADPALKVVYVAAGCHEEREADVRRAGIHFFLLPESIEGELPLVLAPLARPEAAEERPAPASTHRAGERA